MVIVGVRKKMGLGKKLALFVAVLALSAGVVTSTTSWASGETVGSESQAVAKDAYTYPQQFDAALGNALTTLASNPDNNNVSSAFYASYVSASQDYGVSLLSAAATYAQDYKANPDAAKNAYIDNFNHAGDTYFNSLEVARNTVVSELSGKDDVAKDMFVNEYNAARDTYRNQIESVKNRLANL